MKTLRVLAAGAIALALAYTPVTASAQGLRFTGYADFEASVSNIGSGNSESQFDAGHFNLLANGKLYKDLFASAEVEFEHAGDEIGLEYGFITYTGIRNVRISAGKFLVPFGSFNKDIHPSFINKLPGRPLGFRHIVPTGYSDVGIWLSGGAPAGDGVTVTYDAFIVNGLMGDDGGDIRGLRDNITDELPGGGVDDNKAVGGRLGIVVAPQGLSFGVSGYTGNYVNVADSSLTLSMFDFDALYQHQGFELRGEVVFANQDATGGDLTKKGAYIQAAYLTKVHFEPIIRFSFKDMPGNSLDARRVALGASYYLSPNSSVRFAYNLNYEDSGFKTDNNQIMTQFNVLF
ncbi:MAG: hypothetical protein ACE5HT_04270 [Gemmatimonadales bacterium]